jgi:hypothetical protein
MFIPQSVTILLMNIFAPNVVGMVSVTCANLVENFNDFLCILLRYECWNFFMPAGIVFVNGDTVTKFCDFQALTCLLGSRR